MEGQQMKKEWGNTCMCTDLNNPKCELQDRGVGCCHLVDHLEKLLDEKYVVSFSLSLIASVHLFSFAMLMNHHDPPQPPCSPRVELVSPPAYETFSKRI